MRIALIKTSLEQVRNAAGRFTGTLPAGILNTVLVISILIAVLLSSMIMLGYYHHTLEVRARLRQQLANNARSGLQYILGADQLRTGETHLFDLYGEGKDSVLVEKRQWGLFDVGVSIAIRGQQRDSLASLLGVVPDKYGKSALYLAEDHRPLSVAGLTKIRGTCYLPKAGIRAASNESDVFIGDKYVKGKVFLSDTALPVINSQYLRRVEAYAMQGEGQRPGGFNRLLGLQTVNANSFFAAPIRYSSSQDLYLDGLTIRGNIVINSSKSVTLGRNCRIEDAIIVAEHIVVETGFSGRVQLIARKHIMLQEGCQLHYPSVVALIGTDAGKRLEVGRGSTVSGVVYVGGGFSVDNPTGCVVAEGATIEGQAYINGLVEHQGVIHGSLACRKFILQTATTLYENHLFKAEVDASRLSDYFVTSELISMSSSREIIRWLD